MGTTKISHICSCIDLFHKVLHDFQVKNSVSSNKRIERSDIQVVSIMSWLFVNSFVISLDWTIHSNLDFVLKSFRFSKGDVWDVFCLQLYEMNPQNCRRKKLDDEITENWHKIWRMNWHVTAVIGYICFLFFTFRSVRLTCKYTLICTVFAKCMMIRLILWAYKLWVYILPMKETFFVTSKPPQ